MGESVGIPITFVIAGLVPVIIGVLAIVLFRMPADELAHQAEPGGPFTP